MSHAEYTGVTRDTPMEKALFACDELAGFITAVALIKPGKSLAEVDTKSVRKRMKDKAFARKVNRDDIINGAADSGRRSRRAHRLLHRSPEADRDKLGLGWQRGEDRVTQLAANVMRNTSQPPGPVLISAGIFPPDFALSVSRAESR